MKEKEKDVRKAERREEMGRERCRKSDMRKWKEEKGHQERVRERNKDELLGKREGKERNAEEKQDETRKEVNMKRGKDEGMEGKGGKGSQVKEGVGYGQGTC